MYRVRGQLANESMSMVVDETHILVERFGYDGAADYLNWQMYLLRNMRERKENFGGDNYGDNV